LSSTVLYTNRSHAERGNDKKSVNWRTPLYL